MRVNKRMAREYNFKRNSSSEIISVWNSIVYNRNLFGNGNYDSSMTWNKQSSTRSSFSHEVEKCVSIDFRHQSWSKGKNKSSIACPNRFWVW